MGDFTKVLFCGWQDIKMRLALCSDLILKRRIQTDFFQAHQVTNGSVIGHPFGVCMAYSSSTLAPATKKPSHFFGH